MGTPSAVTKPWLPIEAAKATSGVKASAGPGSLRRVERPSSSSAKRTSQMGQQKEQHVVSTSRRAVMARLTTSPRKIFAPAATLVGVGGTACAPPAPEATALASEEASGTSDAVGDPPSADGGLSSRRAMSEALTISLSRWMSFSLICRKTSSRVVHATPRSRTPNPSRACSMAAKARCKAERSCPGSRSTRASTDCPANSAAGTWPRTSRSNSELSKRAPGLLLVRVRVWPTP
mmetsp:Transcript_6935/g.22727  ORF Transcript_6935/g.22727 Transcript_6935/m.22727 type:complete len:234 (+) Transcript_6935:2590-3291(+)|eukprot:scaffold3076_cov117-Isochrysis_galbana.AAC.6